MSTQELGLQLDGVVKRYKKEVVLDDIRLEVQSGRTLVLFGPSGGGKTVLLRLIAGVIDPDAGRILVDGVDMNGVDPEARGIGMAFQNFALFPHMSAYQNIASSLEVKGPASGTLAEAVDKVARLLKIDHVLDHAPRELSNGQKQRTALARALVGSPSLLLLDDPLRNVDAKLRFEMRLELPALLREQNTTVVYVTQDYKEAMALGDTIAVLSAGVIEQVGTPEDIYLYPASIDIARQFGDPVINLLDVSVQDGDTSPYVVLSDKPLALPADYASVAPAEAVVGLRAESLSLSTIETDAGIPVTIEAVTPLNKKIVTLVRTIRGREILVSRPAESDGPEAGDAWLEINTGELHLFERDNGRRVNPVAGEMRASA